MSKPYVRPKRPRVDWKAVWPIPLAITAAAGLTFGLFTAVARAPKDDPGVPLAAAREAYGHEKFTDVIEIINKDLLPYINAGKLTAEQEKDFFALRARSLYYGQERLGISQVENFKAILAAYEQAKRRELTLEPADVGNMAESYLYTGDVNKAVELARKLEGKDDARRLRLYERIVVQQMKEKAPTDAVLSLLNEMLQMPPAVMTVDKRAWVVSRQAQIRLDAGFPQEAITRLLREMPKFDALPRELRADLLFVLGKAYADGVDGQQAMLYLDQAMKSLLSEKESPKAVVDHSLPGITDAGSHAKAEAEGDDKESGGGDKLVIDRFDPRIGEALVIQGRILAENGQIEEARERFQMVRESFKESSVYAQALLGEADTAAALAEYDNAMAYYSQAAEYVAANGARPATPGVNAVSLDLIGSKLMDQHNRRVLENDPKEALRFVRKAQEVYQRLGAVPSGVFRSVAEACRLNAQIMLRDAAGTQPGEATPRPAEVEPVAATTAKSYLLDAGQNFVDYAKAIAGSRHDASMQSLLAAGDCFDLGGDAPAAKDAYSTFLSGASDGYPGKPEAMFRIAQVFQSTGDFGIAAKYYSQLVDGGRSGFAGKWADMSLVPLARCYMSDPTLVVEEGEKGKANPQAPAEAGADKPNELKAIALLTRAISGRTGVGPEAVQMREAQVELAELYYRRGEFRQAIELFNRLVDTYHDQTPRLPTVLFKRADAHRQLGMQIIAVFDQRPLGERAELVQAQQAHLRDARAGYQEAIAAIAKRGSRASKVEKLYQRNSAFYTADCAYLLGEYEQAVQEYARAGELHASSPAALVAKVQTVSAFIKLERWDDAQVAAERAKSFLATIPDDAWSNPDELLPMERRHWEAWLAARLELDRMGYKTAGVNSSGR